MDILEWMTTGGTPIYGNLDEVAVGLLSKLSKGRSTNDGKKLLPIRSVMKCGIAEPVLVACTSLHSLFLSSSLMHVVSQ